MNRTRSLVTGLTALAVAVAMVSTLAAQTAVEGTAKVIRLKGAARYTAGGNVWQPVKVGTILRPGTIVQTSKDSGSFVDLVLFDSNAPLPTPAVYRPYIPSSMASSGSGYQPSAEQNTVRIYENTAVGLDKLSSMQIGSDPVTETQLDLKQGHIAGNVKKMSAASKYEIKLPNGVAGIRGTVYDIRADGIVKVGIGSVVLAWVDPKTGNVVTQVVMGGQQYNAVTGQLMPLSPTELQTLTQVALDMRVLQTPTPVTIASDRTLQNVSPVK